MNGITAWMEKYLVPVAAKIGSQKHLVALRDSFIGMLPLTLAGAFATMISAIIGTFPQAIQQLSLGGEKFQTLSAEHPEQLWTLAKTPVFEQLNGIAGLVNTGTLTIIGLIFAFSWGFNLSKAYKVNDLAGGLLGVATLFAGLPDMNAKITAALGTSKAGVAAAGKVSTMLGNEGFASWKMLFAGGQLDAGAYFTVMIMVAISVIIYAKLMLADITIKMPDTVPPAVATAFLTIIPTIIGLFVSSVIYYIFNIATGHPLVYLIGEYIAKPFQALSQNIFSVLIVSLFVSILWFFGIHGPNVLAPALDGIWGPLGLWNNQIYKEFGISGIHDLISKGATSASKAIDGNYVNMWVRGSWDAFSWFGGSGGTITLVIAILVFSKRQDYKVVARLGLAPGLFNINEPVLFGLPIVLNPVFVIPFTIAPLISVIIAYGATMAHLVNPVVLQTVWVTPPILNAYMATGFDWRAIILAVINLAITFFIWAPFVISANKLEEAELESEEAVLD
ncbi:PTS sugar transporter subunit IIC [Lactovum odontotermitis]